LTDGSAKLVGTRSVFPTASDAFKTVDDLRHIHSLYQAGNALEIAMAATQEGNVMQLAINDVEVYLFTAGLFGLIGVVHLLNSLIC
jgi:hypothetical protein